MKIDREFLKSKVARRILVLFVFCALVPISALAVISFSEVTDHLRRQRQQQLRQLTKALGMSVFERLCLVESELTIFSAKFQGRAGASVSGPDEGYGEGLKKRFMGLARVTGAGTCTPFFGRVQGPVEPSAQERQHLSSGKALVLTRPGEDKRLHIYMMKAVDPKDPNQGILYGEINALYLWGLDEYNTLPSMTELCVLDESDQLIFSTVSLPLSLQQRICSESSRSSLGHFEWSTNGSGYLASFWSIFLKYNFYYPRWTVVLSESKDHYFAPIAYFKKVFPLVIVLSLLFVFFLSAIQIRRTMLPLEQLKDGTEMLAMGDLDTRVTVNSADEFEELAASFNNMAEQLENQFHAMSTMSEIDRAILSTLDTGEIIDTVVYRIHDFFGYGFINVSLLDPKEKNSVLTYNGSGRPFVVKQAVKTEITEEEIQELIDNRDMALKNVNEGFPPYLAPLVTDEIQVFAVVPFFFKQDLKGIISLGFSDSSEGHFKNLPHVRKLADQVAIAVSNAQLMEDLNQLNWGTLTALARTVDAKSPWTAGHTERVTQISGEIGRVLGLTPDERVKLHKAALLHDIGKIGVPASILDKPGRLTDKEFRIIQRHPRTGARILEPIAAYAPIMPIVLQHHERFDGSGYPEGLSGKQICLGARILAVADVYDALTSERPYRAAMTQEQAIDIIQKETGRHFDPDVVKAFLQVVGQEQSALGVDETKKAHIGIRGNVVNFPVTAEKASPTGSG